MYKEYGFCIRDRVTRQFMQEPGFEMGELFEGTVPDLRVVLARRCREATRSTYNRPPEPSQQLRGGVSVAMRNHQLWILVLFAFGIGVSSSRTHAAKTFDLTTAS